MAIQDLLPSGVISESGISLSYAYIFYTFSRKVRELYMCNILLVVVQHLRWYVSPLISES